MPTVEVIRGFQTSDRTVEILLQLFSRPRKEAIVRRRHARLRLQQDFHLFMNEPVCPAGRVADAEKIDLIFKKCFGHKMGPLETAT